MILSILLMFFIQTQDLKKEILSPGSGIALLSGDTIVVHYEGTVKGQSSSFENSRDYEPIRFVVGKEDVIAGWDQGLVGVKKGMKLRLTIPPHLGYGDAESSVIPANSTLIFDIDVLSIHPGPRRIPIPASSIEQKRDHVVFYDVESGSGDHVTDESSVSYHYRLFNKNNVLVFSTYDYGTESMDLKSSDHLIKGFRNGLPGMKVGGKRILICEGPFNTPEDTFIYEVELISIK